MGGTKLYYRADFSDYMVSSGERSAAIGFVEGLDRHDYRTVLADVKNEMETAVQNRSTSLDKYKLLQQRRRRMSVVAPINDKGNVLDFEERIAICKTIKKQERKALLLLISVDSDFRNALFKLTAMLIHNIDTSGLRH